MNPPDGSTVTSSFLAALVGEAHATVPVWFMRQAGRALPEYRAVRDEHSFHEVVTTPELAAEVTMQPVRRYGVDAAILFSDIVTPIMSMGVGVEIRPGVGPVVERPLRTRADLDRLRPFEPDVDAPFVAETVRILARDLDVPLIGFAGAPFTVASYLVEGGPSKSYARTKAMMLGDESTWHLLLQRLADITIASLRAQVDAGARAVQLFDSWAGACSPPDYERYVLPHSQRILAALADVPRIHFGVATGELLSLMGAAGPDVVGVDWRVPLDAARQRVPDHVGLQGNLDAAACLAPWEAVAAAVDDVLRRSGGHPHYVFNLGHGVLPATDPGILRQVVERVHERGNVQDL